MKISYRNTNHDQLAFALYHFPRSPLFLFATIGFLLCITIGSVVPGIPNDRPLAVKICFVIFCETLIAIFVTTVWQIIVLAGIISRKNKPLLAERTMIFGEEGFVSETSFARSEFLWPTVQKLARTRRCIFLCLNKNAAVIVPRRAFEVASQWYGFHDYCQNKTRLAFIALPEPASLSARSFCEANGAAGFSPSALGHPAGINRNAVAARPPS